jgi:RecB family exonuclease
MTLNMSNNPQELNYSKIKTYGECPHLFKLKYIDGKREGLCAATSLGVSIHRTLEDYHSNCNDPKELLNYYDKRWLRAGYKNAAEQAQCYLKGKNMLEVYAQREYSRESEIVSTEREFIFSSADWSLRGKIDRVDRLPDGSWEVIDYKTDIEIDENFDIKKSLQLSIYSIGARKAWDMQRGKASIYFVAFDKKISANFDDFDEKATLEAFIKTGELIKAQKFDPNTSHCAKCLMNNRCPHSSIKREEAL